MDHQHPVRTRQFGAQAVSFDAVIVGAGIAGVSLAANLAPDFKVAVLEWEDAPGVHSTGRSAAVFAGAYGNAAIRALTQRSLPHFRHPPDGFCHYPLLTQRGMLFVARSEQREALWALHHRVASECEVRCVDAAQARELFPLLRRDYADAGMWDEAAADIDVNALLQGYLALVRRHGGVVMTGCCVTHAERRGGLWSVTTSSGGVQTPLLINASGAWADIVARASGVAEIGLRPLRRTAFTIDLAANTLPAHAPVLIDVDETFYAKPDAGALLGSPADETESPPCDARPEDIDIAIGVDRLERALEVSVKTIRSRWAGLRTFAPDRTPVVGFDAEAEGFFWLAGQGGYGVQTAPGVADIAGQLIRQRSGARATDLPAHLLAAIDPRRFKRDPTLSSERERREA